MKKLVVVGSILACATALFAEPVATATVQVPKESGAQHMMRVTGGRIARPGTQQGQVVYVNCQKAADVAWLEESRAYFEKESRFNIAIKDGTFDLRAPAIQGNASLFIIDDPALPALLCAPEDRWTMVNVAKLKSDKLPFFHARVVKELARGFSFLCGASNSQYPQALTGGITKAEDLDRHTDARLPVDVIARYAPYMKPFGVTPAQMTTYRNACQQGWAPAPTNEFQQAIWDAAHTIPDKPIQIKFDPKQAK